MNFKNRIVKLLALGLMVIIALSIFPQNTLSDEAYVLEPYTRIAKLADGESAYQYVDRLTQNDFEGRQAGSSGCDKAAEWIADKFKTFGLKSFKPDSYFQSLEVPYFNYTSPLEFQYQIENEWINTQYRKDFIVYSYSGEGSISNSCVFVGFGVQVPKAEYDDYKGIAVAGKTALMLYDFPHFLQDEDINSSIYQRIDTARALGATSVVLLLRSDKDPPDIFFKKKIWAGDDAKIPVILAQVDLSQSLIAQSGKALKDIIKNIETSKKPASFSCSLELKIQVNYVSEKRISANVIGYIPAADPEVKESVLVISHYDALGADADPNVIFRGANDNASATACMLEVARTLSQRTILPATNIVFISFTGEEEGLVGSYYYIDHPLFPIRKIKAVFNSEEIGTIEGVNAVGTSKTIYPELSRLMNLATKLLKVNIQFVPQLLVPCSDHYPFHEKNIPSVMFARATMITGYPEYHTLEDTIKIISPKSLEIFCQLITLMTLSYSKAAFFDDSTFSANQKIIHPFVTFNNQCYLPNSDNFSVNINRQKLEPPINSEVDLFIPLTSGDNKIEFEIKYKNKAWVEKSLTLFCDPDPNLRADFNQDFVVDTIDLSMLSKKLRLSTKPYYYDTLFDLNLDQKITEQDYQLFKDFFGYKTKMP
jgi:hypothetical protein